MKPFSILHISDLHRSPRDPITNDELISALVGDRDRYIHEDPAVPVPEAVVVSGDLIQGVPLNTADYEAELARQYSTAEEFLDELVRRFLNGDRSRLILIPGNHDIDWNTAFAALEPVERKDFPSNLAAFIYAEDSKYRWDWKTLTLYRIADPALYARRLEAFWTFCERFYAGVPGLLKVMPNADANLFSLCDGRIGLAAFNSCHGNDCFAFHGLIRKEVVARSHLELNDIGMPFNLRIAVWHHSIEGPPYRTDYMDVDIVRGMIGREFRLGLYGHQHKAQITPHQVWLPDRERMAVVSAGSLCAGAYELPTGVHRQYNVIEIAPDFQSARIHVRAMTVANLFSRGHLMEFGGTSFADLDWKRPNNAAGVSVDADAARTRQAIEKAEAAAKTGDPPRAIDLLKDMPLPTGSYQRELLLTAASDAQDWGVIIKVTDPPASIQELIQRVEAFDRSGDQESAADALDRFAAHLQFPEAMASELRRRIKAQKAMKK
ncbi:metallophosphoesterase [Thioalkalivibrio paradoxus]|uniref:Calcineurin-like phosphoesterase domain-containing protein n=1 Tax=Thioalkalivibrio paradoxus ARh 1 TaxID=713585 RepID=W0DSA0_9GAMM|nr:metallophosphoesterase [Thioalkalivibrio paradoxus]AHE99858.1 hypothetical protein THITH_01855 [Thioalkalivibrio paradoxus ARh 1]